MKPEDRERYHEELLKALNRVDTIQAEQRAAVSHFKDEIEQAQLQVKLWRDVLGGKAGVQLPMPLETALKGPLGFSRP